MREPNYEEAHKELTEYLLDEYGCATLSPETLRTAAAAVKLMIPQRRVAQKYEYRGITCTRYVCPTCGRTTEISMIRIKRCECGQALITEMWGQRNE